MCLLWNVIVLLVGFSMLVMRLNVVDLLVLFGLISLMICFVFMLKLMLLIVISLLNCLCVLLMMSSGLLVMGFVCCGSGLVCFGICVCGLCGNSFVMNGYMFWCVYCSSSIISMLNMMILKLFFELSSFGSSVCR